MLVPNFPCFPQCPAYLTRSLSSLYIPMPNSITLHKNESNPTIGFCFDFLICLRDALLPLLYHKMTSQYVSKTTYSQSPLISYIREYIPPDICPFPGNCSITHRATASNPAFFKFPFAYDSFRMSHRMQLSFTLSIRNISISLDHRTLSSAILRSF